MHTAFVEPATKKTTVASGTLRVPQLDVILPCYNPPEGWAAQLTADFRQLREALPNVNIQPILVIDGPARHITPVQLELLRHGLPGIQIIEHPVNRGKGYAMRLGVAIAGGSCQVCTDLDFPFGHGAIAEAYDLLQHGADVVAGVRGQHYTRLLPLKRKMLTRINRALNRYLLHLKVTDAQAGLKAFNSKGRAELLATRVDGFLYDSEFMRRSSKNNGLVISTVRIYCREGIRFSDFRPRVLRRELFNFFSILMPAQP